MFSQQYFVLYCFFSFVLQHDDISYRGKLLKLPSEKKKRKDKDSCQKVNQQ